MLFFGFLLFVLFFVAFFVCFCLGHYVLLFNNNKENQTDTNNNKQTNQKIDNKKIK
jgi:hypothetical protein